MYAPLYIAGPIMSFNTFASQVGVAHEICIFDLLFVVFANHLEKVHLLVSSSFKYFQLIF